RKELVSFGISTYSSPSELIERFGLGGRRSLETLGVGQLAGKFKPDNKLLPGFTRGGPNHPAGFGALAEEKFHNLAGHNLAGKPHLRSRFRKINRGCVLDKVFVARGRCERRPGREGHALFPPKLLTG